VIDPGGVVRIKLPWAEPEVLGPRLEALLADPIVGIAPTAPWRQRMGAALNLLHRGKVLEATARIEALAAAQHIIDLGIPEHICPVPDGEPAATRTATDEAARLARILDHDPGSPAARHALRSLLQSTDAAPWHAWARRVLETARDDE
jgi:hypothetical protein